MRTAGIDLAAQDRNTALCVIDWQRAGPAVSTLQLGVEDDELLRAIARSKMTGIDAPFGWPEPFVQAVAAHAARRAWPGRGRGLNEYRQTLRLRATDLVVKDADRGAGITPLSVSTEKIGVTTFRCALLLDRVMAEERKKVDRTGVTGCVAETYPAAALQRWGISRKGYKGRDGRQSRVRILRAIQNGLRIRFPEHVRKRCYESDHQLDALVCALVARAIERNQTTRPTGREERRLAAREGWIHLPAAESLAQLAG